MAQKKKTKKKKVKLNKKNSWNKSETIKKVLYAVLFIIVFFMLLISFSSHWALNTWGGLSMDEIVYHIKAPLEGTESSLIIAYVFKCIVPAVLILVFIVLMKSLKYKWKKILFPVSMIGSSLFFVISVYHFWTKLDVSEYIKDQKTESSFIQNHYVNPNQVSIEFPNEKRNLIFIYLESMETTYADEKNGGAFSDNYIPELTKLAQDNEDFSGNKSILNGAHVMPATSWTMAALFGHTSGLPLQISIADNSMDTQEAFFPSLITLGDILEEEGYKQVFMIGSDASFGGRKLYFSDHGSYELLDYFYALEQGLIPKHYKVFWGYEDKRLFSFAKEQLLQLSKESEPFNVTLLTVDTHFEDGYLCEDCDTTFGNNKYANVMACSSRQVDEFITWIQNQDFYENTTVILVGDHLTMDRDFCTDINSSYDRKVYVSYINSALEPEQKEQTRTYTTFDTFPTTLAALGVEIQGNRLGLGTNLFSSEKTLAEQYGLDYLVKEVGKKSAFMAELAKLDKTSDSYLKRVGKFPSGVIDIQYDQSNEMAFFSVSNIKNLNNLSAIEIEINTYDKKESQIFSFDKSEDGKYVLNLDWNDYKEQYSGGKIYVIDSTGRRYQIEELPGDISLYTKSLFKYLTLLKKKENCTVFIAVRDEASSKLSLNWQKGLWNLGLKEDLSKEFRSSYYAVIRNGRVLSEKMGQEALQENGTLNQGKDSYYILSSGYNAGPGCEIQINGVEYAQNSRGINIVVYDNEHGRVVDSVCFDTYDGKTFTRNGEKSTIVVETEEEMDLLQAELEEKMFIPLQVDESLQVPKFDEYISAIKEKEAYTIFIVTKDGDASNFTEARQHSLKELGLTEELFGKDLYSYYAIIEQGNIQEEIGLERLEKKGILQNGSIAYEVTSIDNGNGRASVKLNQQEFAVGSAGINIVVYDNEKNCVVSSICFK